MMTNIEDSALFEDIGVVLKAQFDLEEVQNDPALLNMKEVVAVMVSDYNINKSGNKENEKFIQKSLSGDKNDNKISEEIKSIKLEINDNNLNALTAEWVKEWHEKKQKTGTADPKTEEIRNFITGAIAASETESREITLPAKHSRLRKMIIRYTAFSSAALLAGFFLIKTLLPGMNTEKIFSSNYEPYKIISTVTRTINSSGTDGSLSLAIENYKSGNYEKAAAILGGIAERNPSSEASFLLGLSEIEIRNYEQAVNLLTSVSDDASEYRKEAIWYLGLTYLKMQNKTKARECFTALGKSDGYYQARSETILRRLK